MLTRREERLLRTLGQRKIREQEGLFVVEGIRAVEDLLASPLQVRLAVGASTLEDTVRGAALRRALDARLEVREVGERELRDLADTDAPQGVLAIAEAPHGRLDDLSLDREPAVILVLDAVQ